MTFSYVLTFNDPHEVSAPELKYTFQEIIVTFCSTFVWVFCLCPLIYNNNLLRLYFNSRLMRISWWNTTHTLNWTRLILSLNSLYIYVSPQPNGSLMIFNEFKFEFKCVKWIVFWKKKNTFRKIRCFNGARDT